MVAYRALLDVPRELVAYVAGLLAAERRARGTRAGTRALSCWWQAVVALVWFCERRNILLTGQELRSSQATAYRYLAEASCVLATQASDLHQARQRVADDGYSHVVLAGPVMACNRLAEKTSKKGKLIGAWQAGKTSGFGGNSQAGLRPDGLPVWVADVDPGSTPDRTAARPHLLGALYWAAAQLRLPTPADSGYRSTGIGVHPLVPHPADGGTRAYHLLPGSLRCRGERGFALLTGRQRPLQHVTPSPSKTGHIAKAALVPTHVEHSYPTT